jgi:hypothetical protein
MDAGLTAHHPLLAHASFDFLNRFHAYSIPENSPKVKHFLSPPPRVLAYGVTAQVLVGELVPSARLALGEPLSAPHLCARILLVRGFVFPFYGRTTIFTFAFVVRHWYNITHKQGFVKGWRRVAGFAGQPGRKRPPRRNADARGVVYLSAIYLAPSSPTLRRRFPHPSEGARAYPSCRRFWRLGQEPEEPSG